MSHRDKKESRQEELRRLFENEPSVRAYDEAWAEVGGVRRNAPLRLRPESDSHHQPPTAHDTPRPAT